MGVCGIDKDANHKRLEQRYALDNAKGVRLLLSEYHALIDRRYKGDMAASDVIIDIANAIDKADLTNRQRQALYYVYIEDLTQKDAGERLGCTKQTLNRLIGIATTKIARVYEYWARRGEGYSVGENKEDE